MPDTELTIRGLQHSVDEYIRTIGVRYFSPLTNMAVLAEETGEVARAMARLYGDQSAKSGESLNLADELADVMWVVAAIANQTGIDLTDAMAANIAKKTERDALRHIHNPKLTSEI
ncbi:MAG: nucleotide pyrophosphohydrolase [Muribaculaceae bacterium]|nr:nucleotide pyrophosphohydrolase [Muribaculaceae bacterium]